MNEVYDLAVLGGGPGGYLAAIRASQLGGRVVLIEERELGGVCTNLGCIPTKALLRSVEILMDIRRAEDFGIVVRDFSIDFHKMMEKKDMIVKRVRDGILYLLNQNGVKIVKGRGVLKDQHTVRVDLDEESLDISAKAIIIATGSRPKIPPISGIDSPNVITSEEVLSLQKAPQNLMIIGGGPEGCEFATIFNMIGCRVTLIEMLPNLLPTEDEELGRRLHRVMNRNGVEVFVGVSVEEIVQSRDNYALVKLMDGKSIEADTILVATGRNYNFEDIGLDEAGVVYSSKGIKVDERMRTSVEGIYAVGDVVGGGLAHVAYAEGVVAAENAMGIESSIDLRAVPRCIYTIPEVAAVGLTEKEAKLSGKNISTGRFLFSASSRAATLGDKEGIIKVVSDSDTKKILGVHIIGPRASDLIPEAALAINLHLTTTQLAKTIHPHPTLSEALAEAALDAEGSVLHMIRRHSPIRQQ